MSRFRLRYMGTATIRQGDVKVEVTATRWDDRGSTFPFPDQTYRWGGTFSDFDDDVEAELAEGEATFRFHDAIEGEARIARLPSGYKRGTFRGTSELRSLY